MKVKVYDNCGVTCIEVTANDYYTAMLDIEEYADEHNLMLDDIEYVGGLTYIGYIN